MKYLSAKEMAEKWGLGLRSVQNYCANGRIPGAQNLGKQWIIPADAERPSDTRGKASKPGADAYLFPLFVFSPAFSYSENLNAKEQALFMAELKMLEGEHTECIRLCREILKLYAPQHVKMGAYYSKAYSALILGNFDEYQKSLAAMESILSLGGPHSEDYKLMLISIKRYIGWNHRLFDAINVSDLSSDAMYLYQYECLLSVVVGNKVINLDALHVFDTLASQLALEGIAPLEAHMRFALGSLHFSVSDSAGEEFFDTACRLAYSNNWLGIIDKNFSLSDKSIKRTLDAIAPGSYKKVANTASKNYNNWRLVNSLASGVYPFENFSQSDVCVMFMVYQGMSNSDICTVMDLTSKELNDILKNCYKTANVKNRTELKKYAVSQLSTWHND